MLKRTTFLLNQGGFFEDVVTGLASGNYKVWFSKNIKGRLFKQSLAVLNETSRQFNISLVRCAHSWAIELNAWEEIS